MYSCYLGHHVTLLFNRKVDWNMTVKESHTKLPLNPDYPFNGCRHNSVHTQSVNTWHFSFSFSPSKTIGTGLSILTNPFSNVKCSLFKRPNCNSCQSPGFLLSCSDPFTMTSLQVCWEMASSCIYERKNKQKKWLFLCQLWSWKSLEVQSNYYWLL